MADVNVTGTAPAAPAENGAQQGARDFIRERNEVTRSQRQEIKVQRIELEMVEHLLLDVAGFAAAAEELCSQSLQCLDERDKVAYLLVAIQALSQRIGAACDSHHLGAREPREWIFSPEYNRAAKQLEEVDHV